MAEKSAFQFQGFRIIKTLIDRKEGVIGENIKIGIHPEAVKNITRNVFDLILTISLNDNNDVFTSEVTAIGKFVYPKDAEENLLDNFFYTNAPAILFPYIRAYISTLTTMSGFDVVTLPTLNMHGVREDLIKNTKTVE